MAKILISTELVNIRERVTLNFEGEQFLVMVEEDGSDQFGMEEMLRWRAMMVNAQEENCWSSSESEEWEDKEDEIGSRGSLRRSMAEKGLPENCSMERMLETVKNPEFQENQILEAAKPAKADMSTRRLTQMGELFEIGESGQNRGRNYLSDLTPGREGLQKLPEIEVRREESKACFEEGDKSVEVTSYVAETNCVGEKQWADNMKENKKAHNELPERHNDWEIFLAQEDVNVAYGEERQVEENSAQFSSKWSGARGSGGEEFQLFSAHEENAKLLGGEGLHSVGNSTQVSTKRSGTRGSGSDDELISVENSKNILRRRWKKKRNNKKKEKVKILKRAVMQFNLDFARKKKYCRLNTINESKTIYSQNVSAAETSISDGDIQRVNQIHRKVSDGGDGAMLEMDGRKYNIEKEVAATRNIGRVLGVVNSENEEEVTKVLEDMINKEMQEGERPVTG